MVSALSEQNVNHSLQVNVIGFHNVLEVCRKYNLRLFSPSTIGAFGPETPKNPTPDLTIQRPKTVYGVAKVYMELLGEVHCDSRSEFHLLLNSLFYQNMNLTRIICLKIQGFARTRQNGSPNRHIALQF